MKKLIVITFAILSVFTFASPALSQLRVITAPQGGTGIGSVTSGDIGSCLKVLNNSPFQYELGSCGSGGSGSPGGSGTQVQFNDGGNFGGDAGFTYLKASDTGNIGILGVGTTATPSSTLHVVGTFTVTGTSTLANVSSTNFSASGFLNGATLNISGLSSLAAVSSTNLTASGFLNSATLNTSGAAVIGTTLNVTGKSTLAAVSSTALTASGDINAGANIVINGDTIADFTGTGLIMSGTSLTASLGTSVDLTAEVTGILPIANGGTNLSAASDDNLMLGNGTTWQSKALTTCTDTGGNHLNYDASTNTFSCGTSGPSGSSTTTINSVNGPNFTFNTSSTGSDFTISTSTATVNFNLPTASASNRGLLSTTDWSTFNSKVSTSRTITAGTGLTGGGDLSADRTISLSTPVAATNISPSIASSTISFNFYDATTTAPYKYQKVFVNFPATIQKVYCDEYASATTTLQLYRVTSNGSYTNAQDYLSSITCGIAGNSTTSFSTTTIPVDSWLVANSTSTAGTPSLTTVHITFKKTD